MSVIEESGLMSWAIAAHELGHRYGGRWSNARRFLPLSSACVLSFSDCNCAMDYAINAK